MEQKQLSPEQLQSRKKANKITLIVFLVICAFIGMIVIIAKSNSKSENTEEIVQEQDNIHLKGLEPIDVYINLENNGFKTEKTHSNDGYGTSWLWQSKRLLGGAFDAIVDTYSDNTKSVITVRATILSNADVQPRAIDTSLCISLFDFLATLPFEANSENQILQTKAWIAQNINIDNASMHFGDIKMTIFAPTEFTRMFLIEKYAE